MDPAGGCGALDEADEVAAAAGTALAEAGTVDPDDDAAGSMDGAMGSA